MSKSVLFVCRSNGARSQMAEAFFQKYSNKPVKSAGIDVAETKWAGKPPGSKTIEIMKKNFGIDVSRKEIKQVTLDMIKKTDKIVILMSYSERKGLPAYFNKFKNKIVFWNVKDMRNIESNPPLIKRAKRIRNMVQKLVKSL